MEKAIHNLFNTFNHQKNKGAMMSHLFNDIVKKPLNGNSTPNARLAPHEFF